MTSYDSETDKKLTTAVHHMNNIYTTCTFLIYLQFANKHWDTVYYWVSGHWALGRVMKRRPVSEGCGPTHTVTGKILLAAVMVMQVLNTTCSQCPCSTHSSEFQDTGRVKVMFISSWASRPTTKQKKKTGHFGNDGTADYCTTDLIRDRLQNPPQETNVLALCTQDVLLACMATFS